jgi:hypothetical protein
VETSALSLTDLGIERGHAADLVAIANNPQVVADFIARLQGECFHALRRVLLLLSVE